MKLPNGIIRDDTVHGVVYYAAKEVDAIIADLTRERTHANDCFDAAKEEIERLTAEKKGDGTPVAHQSSPTAGMNLGDRIAHVGGIITEAQRVEFGSVMAVQALVHHVLRDAEVRRQPIGADTWMAAETAVTVRSDVQCAMLYVLYRHQGASSRIGQPIRKILGMGQFDRMTTEQVEMAQSVVVNQGVRV